MKKLVYVLPPVIFSRKPVVAGFAGSISRLCSLNKLLYVQQIDVNTTFFISGVFGAFSAHKVEEYYLMKSLE